MKLFKKLSRTVLCVFALITITNAAQAQQLTDEALKTNIGSIAQPLKVLQSLQPLSYEYRTQEYKFLKLPTGPRFGFMAEDFQKVLPGLVYSRPYSYATGKNSTRMATVKSIDMESLIPVLVASIQEQQAQINQLKAELEALRNK